jgi:hypothetical protein
MNEKDTQTAAMLSLSAQSRLDVMFMRSPLSEWRGKLAEPMEPEKGQLRHRAAFCRQDDWLTDG